MVLTYLHVLDPGIPIELQIYSEANDQWEFHGPIHGGMLVPYIYVYKTIFDGDVPEKIGLKKWQVPAINRFLTWPLMKLVIYQKKSPLQ